MERTGYRDGGALCRGDDLLSYRTSANPISGLYFIICSFLFEVMVAAIKGDYLVLRERVLLWENTANLPQSASEENERYCRQLWVNSRKVSSQLLLDFVCSDPQQMISLSASPHAFPFFIKGQDNFHRSCFRNTPAAFYFIMTHI